MPARREWFTHYATTGRYRVLVATTATNVLGYASSSPYRAKAAYEPSVETSIYTALGLNRQGVGAALYGALLTLLAEEDVYRAYGGIALPNDASIALHERLGFTAGRLLHRARPEVRPVLGCRLVRAIRGLIESAGVPRCAR